MPFWRKTKVELYIWVLYNIYVLDYWKSIPLDTYVFVLKFPN